MPVKQKPLVALMVIVKAGDTSEAKQLATMLGSVNGYVDEIFIELNAPKGQKISQAVRQVAEQFTKEVFTYEWDNNFVNARNFIMKKVPKKYDWLIWADTDDIIESPESIVPVAAVMPEDVNGVHILYDYQTDQFGNVVVSHWSARMVRNNGSYVWRSSFDDDEIAVHETLVPVRESRAVSNNEWKVIHKADDQHFKDSLLRNIELLEGMYQRQLKKPGGPDPRILFYLGSHCYEAYRFNEARDLFYQYLQLSGWNEERSEAHVYMGKLQKMQGKLSGAKNGFLMAIGENPDNINAYLELGKLESKAQRWEQAADWLKRGLDIKPKQTSMVKFNNDYELLTLYAQALSNMGGKNLSQALKIAHKALKLRPFDPDAKQNRDDIQKLCNYRDNLRAVARTLRLLKDEELESNIISYLDLLPASLSDSPVVIDARQHYTEGKVWNKRTIAIYVGAGPLGIWGPWSLNEGGTGGSEEAVVRLSHELTKLGWRVTVFGMPGDRAGIIDDVDWRQYWEINTKDTFDVLVSWRQPAFFDHQWQARRKYLWLHDVMPAEELYAERLKKLDKIIYVSKYHAERPENAHIRASKKLPSGNGIQPEDFTKYDGKFKRDNHRVIYMSANERGLRVLYDIWPDVKKAVPDATLDAYYGWHSFDAVNRDNPERMAWKASMQLKARDLDGVTERGRIGQDDLNKEIFKSGIFAYPCTFPEVYAITYVKALAGGLQAITSDFAVLKEYEDYATQIHLGEDYEAFKEEYKKALIHALKHPMPASERQAQADAVRKKYSWKSTAKGWDEEMR